MSEENDLIDSYVVFFKDARRPPMPVASSIDLIVQYLEQMKEKAKKEQWNLPVEFKDEDGRIIAAFMAQEIMGMAMGMPVSKTELEKQGVNLNGRD